MIALLRGTYVGRAGAACIIDVGGVGYAVHVPQNITLDGQVLLHVSTQVREDAITLFGFDSSTEREVFDLLHSISGVGPKTALAILGHLSLVELQHAIAKGHVAALTKVPGIGKKTAERLCLELKDKLPETFVPDLSLGRGASPPDPLPLALAQLEYRKSEIDKALQAVEVPAIGAASLEERLRAALRVLATSR